MNKNSINGIKDKAKKLLNISDVDMENIEKKNDFSSVIKNLSPENAKKIKSIISDPKKTEAILKSKEAQQIIDKLSQ